MKIPITCSILSLASGFSATPRRQALSIFGGGAGALLLNPQRAPAADFITTASGLQIQEISRPDVTGLVTNAIKAGDYLRLDVKGWVGGFDQTLIESTDKTGTPLTFQVGVGATSGYLGMNKDMKYITVPKGIDEAMLGQTVGMKRRLVIPASLAFGKGGKTSTGYEVPADTTVYYEIRIRSRVFAGLLDRPQENFMEDDQVAKLNAILGIGQ